MWRIGSVLIGLTLIQQGGQSATIPIQLDITDGENAQHLVIDAQRKDFGTDLYSFNESGAASSETWRVEWQLSGEEWLDGNSFGIRPVVRMLFEYSVHNLSDKTGEYNIVARMPVELRGNDVGYQGAFNAAVTDLNGDGAVLTGNLDASSTYYQSLLDGVPFTGLLSGASRTTAPPYESGGFPTPGGSPFNFPCYPCGRWEPGPLVNSDIGIQLAFSVSGQDQARLDGWLYMRQVPEPSTLTIGALLLSAVAISIGGKKRNRRAARRAR